MPNILVVPSLQTSFETNTSIASPKKVIPPCPTSDETLDLALQAQSLTLTRPSVEYASSVRSPHSECQINQLNMVQRQAARIVKHNYARTSSVTNMLTDLKWYTLQQRRINTRTMLGPTEGKINVNTSPLRYLSK